jgi:hypothetical protein
MRRISRSESPLSHLYVPPNAVCAAGTSPLLRAVLSNFLARSLTDSRGNSGQKQSLPRAGPSACCLRNAGSHSVTAPESGARGQIPAEAMHVNGGLAQERQLLAQRNAEVRLELEYVTAILNDHKWTASEVIRRMSMTLSEVGSDARSGNAGDAPSLGGSNAQSAEG